MRGNPTGQYLCPKRVVTGPSVTAGFENHVLRDSNVRHRARYVVPATKGCLSDTYGAGNEPPINGAQPRQKLYFAGIDPVRFYPAIPYVLPTVGEPSQANFQSHGWPQRSD